MGEIYNRSRRSFLKGAGMIGVALLADGRVSVVGSPAEAASANGLSVNAWVTVFADDRVLIRFGATEMGQGVNTALPMIVAEEMDADWSTVSVEQAGNNPDKMFGNPAFGGNLFTAGSTSVTGYFTSLRLAGAAVRRVLIHSAAAQWDVAPDTVSAASGAVTHRASGRTMRFGEIAALGKYITVVPEVTEADLKPRNEWRLMGSDVERLDIPGKTRGEAVYAIDVRLPGMLYAAQLLAPVEGEVPTISSESAARAVPGVVAVISLANSVCVLAKTWEAALTARDRLEVNWSETSPFRTADSDHELEELMTAADDFSLESAVWEDRGDASAVLGRTGERVITSHYTTEHVYHAQMEPLNAVASVDPDGKGAEVWLGSQSQSISIAIAAGVLGTTPERIRYNAMQMGGAFGRRTVFARDLLRDALLLSRTAGRPVKLMWTREDDVKNGWLRPATVHRLDAVLDNSGNVSALRHRVASPSIFEFAFPNRWNPETRRDLLVMEGTESTDYAIADLRAEQLVTPRRSRVSAWRGIGWAPNCYARECFVDELAEAAGQDPVHFRRNLLRNSPRGLAVLNKVVELSNFGNAPDGHAHGLSYAGYKETLGAGVAEVSIGPDGAHRVHKFWAVIDAGIIVHPKNYIAQAEGGIVYGLSSLVRERSSFRDGVVEQSNFYDYDVLRIDAFPEIEVHLIDSEEHPSGGGEIGVPMTGGAVANAIRRLTGAWPKRIPFDGNAS